LGESVAAGALIWMALHCQQMYDGAGRTRAVRNVLSSGDWPRMANGGAVFPYEDDVPAVARDGRKNELL